jgi:hypothetical protein
MAQRIAVAVIHGMGNQSIDYASTFSEGIIKYFMKKYKMEGLQSNTINPVVIEPVYWAPIVQRLEERLWNRVNGDDLDWTWLRRFVVSYLGDAIAYESTFSRDSILSEEIYKAIHDEFAKTLKVLSMKAGKDAPLVIISHSLGTIIASNLVYDLQKTSEITGFSDYSSPLERIETLTSFYTMGSPIALWSLRFVNFGVPITVPSPQLLDFHPTLEGEWLNFIDKDDVLAYPLKNLNEKYNEQVTEDVVVNSGHFVIKETPLSHMFYWDNKGVILKIANGLINIYKHL